MNVKDSVSIMKYHSIYSFVSECCEEVFTGTGDFGVAPPYRCIKCNRFCRVIKRPEEWHPKN